MLNIFRLMEKVCPILVLLVKKWLMIILRWQSKRHSRRKKFKEKKPQLDCDYEASKTARVNTVFVKGARILNRHRMKFLSLFLVTLFLPKSGADTLTAFSNDTDITLQCPLRPDQSFDGYKWSFFPVNGHKKVLCNTRSGVQSELCEFTKHGDLIIGKVGQEHAGRYICEQFIQSETFSMTYDVTVILDFELSCGKINETCNSANQLVSYAGYKNSSPLITWTQNGEDIQSERIIQSIYNNGTTTNIIQSIYCLQNGVTYTAMVNGRSSSSCTIGNGNDENTSLKPENMTVLLNDTDITLNCQRRSNRSLDGYKWLLYPASGHKKVLCNSRSGVQSELCECTKSGDLIIGKVGQKHAGRYICEQFVQSETYRVTHDVTVILDVKMSCEKINETCKSANIFGSYVGFKNSRPLITWTHNEEMNNGQMTIQNIYANGTFASSIQVSNCSQNGVTFTAKVNGRSLSCNSANDDNTSKILLVVTVVAVLFLIPVIPVVLFLIWTKRQRERNRLMKLQSQNNPEQDITGVLLIPMTPPGLQRNWHEDESSQM